MPSASSRRPRAAKAAAEREAEKVAQAAARGRAAKSSLREQIELLAVQKATRDARYAGQAARLPLESRNRRPEDIATLRPKWRCAHPREAVATAR